MTILKQMIDKYDIVSENDLKNVAKEVIQEIVLSGLARTNFFNHAAFYGGTALRIFHTLPRFSEDLDFTLLNANPNFDLSGYLSAIENELNSVGLNLTTEIREKSLESDIQTANITGNLREVILTIKSDLVNKNEIHHHEKIRIKLEIDTRPPQFATTEVKYGLAPTPYQVQIYDLSSLFASKINALLTRKWQTRVKGRDYYDYIHFLRLNVPVNIKHLKARLIKASYINDDYELNKNSLLELLNEKFDITDYQQAREDVMPFINNNNELTLWSADFFKEISKNITIV